MFDMCVCAVFDMRVNICCVSVYVPAELATQRSLFRHASIKTYFLHHITALQVAADLSDIYMGHATWDSYTQVCAWICCNHEERPLGVLVL